MVYYCPECGSEIPNEAEFCYICGCRKDKAIFFDDSGREVCPGCGAALPPGSDRCPGCGAQTVSAVPRMSKNGSLAIMMALLPGILDVHGLGHLMLGEYRKAALFLILSSAILFVRIYYMPGTDPLFGTLFWLGSLAVFIVQGVDVFRLAFNQKPLFRL